MRCLFWLPHKWVLLNEVDEVVLTGMGEERIHYLRSECVRCGLPHWQWLDWLGKNR